MQVSGRNQLKGTVKEIKIDGILAEVLIDVGGQQVCSVITSHSVNNMGLKVGDQVIALVKATSVMLMK